MAQLLKSLPRFTGIVGCPWDDNKAVEDDQGMSDSAYTFGSMDKRLLCWAEFKQAFESKLTAQSVPAPLWIRILRSTLSDVATSELNDFEAAERRKHGSSTVLTYEQVVNYFSQIFNPPTFRTAVLHRLSTIKQGGGTFEQYVLAFKKLMTYMARDSPIIADTVEARAQLLISFGNGLSSAAKTIYDQHALMLDMQNTTADPLKNQPSPSLDTVITLIRRQINTNSLTAAPDDSQFARGTSTAYYAVPHTQPARPLRPEQRLPQLRSDTAPLRRGAPGPTPGATGFRDAGKRTSQQQQYGQKRPKPASVTYSSRSVPLPAMAGPSFPCHHCHTLGHSFVRCPQLASMPDTLKRPDGSELLGVHAIVNRDRVRRQLPAYGWRAAAAYGTQPRPPPAAVNAGAAPAGRSTVTHVSLAQSIVGTPSSLDPTVTFKRFSPKDPTPPLDSKKDLLTPVIAADAIPRLSGDLQPLDLIKVPATFAATSRTSLSVSGGVPLDSGASISCMALSVIRHLGADILPSAMRIRLASGKCVVPVGVSNHIQVSLAGTRPVLLQFLILDDPECAFPVLLGLDCLTATGVTINFRDRSISVPDDDSRPSASSPPHTASTYSVLSANHFIVPTCLVDGTTGPELLYQSSPTEAVDDDPAEESFSSPLSANQAPFADTRPLKDYTDAEFLGLVDSLGVIDKSAPPDAAKIVRDLLLAKRHCFALSATDLSSPAKIPPVRLTGVKPIAEIPRTRHRELRSQAERQAALKQVDEWLSAGIVEEVTGEIVLINNMLVVLKRDNSFRFCLDPRPLNSSTVPDLTEPPSVDNVLHRLYGSQRCVQHI